MIVKILLAFCLLYLGVRGRILNDYDQRFKYSCPKGSVISQIGSVHSNRAEDRIWSVECNKRVSSSSHTGWTYYVNDFDAKMNFQCHNSGVISGIGGYHSNKKEDRRFQFQCTYLGSKRVTNCSWSRYSAWDAKWTYNVPSGRYLVGVKSYHSNRKEDRKFSFLFCKVA